jgi:hypothetical protein
VSLSARALQACCTHVLRGTAAHTHTPTLMRALAADTYKMEQLDTATVTNFVRNARVTTGGLVSKYEYNGHSATVHDALSFPLYSMRGARSLVPSTREIETEHESLELLDEYWVPLTVACTELPSRAMLRLRWRDPKKPPA